MKENNKYNGKNNYINTNELLDYGRDNVLQIIALLSTKDVDDKVKIIGDILNNDTLNNTKKVFIIQKLMSLSVRVKETICEKLNNAINK